MDLDELLRRALEKEAEGSKNRKGLDPEEALIIAEALDKISKIDLDKVAEERFRELTPIEQAAELLKKNGVAARALQRRTAKRPKMHWKKRKNRKKAYERRRYYEVLKPQRAANLADRMLSGEGWWEICSKEWERRKLRVELTQEEFETVLYPAFYPKVPVFFRYDKRGSIRLDNLLVRDTQSREVLFDGKEHKLKMLGFVL